MSKIDFRLHLYGTAPKSALNKLKTLYHSAIRLVLCAFRTTPINNLLLEANILPIEYRTVHAVQKNFKIIMNSKQSPIETIYNKIIKAKRIPKIKSSLHNTIHLSKQLQIQISPITTTKENTPHWVINDRSFNTSLHYTTKANTPPIIYQHKFREYKNTMKDRIFLFTDGSKSSDGASYSLTTEK